MFDIDINTVRAVVTVLSFGTFVGIVAWAWSRRNAVAFAEAARLPFDDEESGSRT